MLLLLLLSKTTILPLGNAVMLVSLTRRAVVYAGSSTLLPCSDLGTKINIPQSLDSGGPGLLSVLIQM